MDYLELLDSYKEDMLGTLKELVSHQSVVSDAVRTEEGEVLPFGRKVHDAYMYVMKVGEEMGFDTFNADNYGGHIELKSENDDAEVFGITAHVDVVPVEKEWQDEAFNMVEKDGFLYGRGVSDDKGPLVASLYAMKAIKESGAKLNKNVRLILGLDEETGKSGIKEYIEMAGQPDLGFTPDGDFPLVNAEMGILIFDLAQKLTRQSSKDGLRLTKLEAGTAPNAVPGMAKAVLAADEKIYELIRGKAEQYTLETGYKLSVKKQGTSLVVEALGKTAHGAHPELGLNAISIIMGFLGRLQFLNDEVNQFIDFYNDNIGFDLHGERMDCEISDEESGKLIFNVGMISVNEDIASMTINIRYPVTVSSEDVYSGIEGKLEKSRIGLVKGMDDKPIYLPVDDPMVESLMSAYREETGDKESKPLVMAGGTYAKDMNKTLAFGAMLPGEEDTMHQNYEKKSIDSLMKAARIYARAIYSICCE